MRKYSKEGVVFAGSLDDCIKQLDNYIKRRDPKPGQGIKPLTHSKES